MNNWQPISTAPKDRRILLAYEYSLFLSKTSNIITGQWDDANEIWEHDLYGHYSLDSIKEYQPIAWQELPVFDGVIAE